MTTITRPLQMSIAAPMSAVIALSVIGASSSSVAAADSWNNNSSSITNNYNETSCIWTLSHGYQYSEFSCIIPSSIQKFYTEYETTYDPLPVLRFMQNHPLVPIVSVLFYMLFIIYGKFIYFADNKNPAWKLRSTLASWNLFLSLFSAMGMIRTAPYLLHSLFTKSIHDNLCSDPLSSYGCGSTGLWVQLFILSKFPELFDTFFIVVHKKPLIFLHWYHHITVLLYCWHSYVTQSPPGIFFVAMNYTVHAFMYFYYYIMAAGYKHLLAGWFNPIIITAMQISQMIVGVIVTLLGFYYYTTDPTCKIEGENNTAAFVMYGSYLFLFLQFFVGRYLTSSKKGIKSSSNTDSIITDPTRTTTQKTKSL